MTMKILLVEDDEDDIFLFTKALETLSGGIILDVTHNGVEALEYLTRNVHEKPQLIFLDINMPLMNGIECLKKIRQHPSLHDLQVVVLTTSNSEKDRQECHNMAAAFFIKPPNVKGLVDTLSQVLSRRARPR
jgi:CheY-like chemotaxis protein